MRIRKVVITAVCFLLLGLGSLVAAEANGESAPLPIVYVGLAFTVAGFIFSTGAWVSNVRTVGRQSAMHHRVLHGDDERGGLVADVQALQVEARKFVTNADVLSVQQQILTRFEERCAAHTRDWRDELERQRQEWEARMNEQAKRIESALAAIEGLVGVTRNQ